MSEVFSIQRRVEFRDTDAAGIVHFSNFFVYMEQAEHAFLRSLGLGVVSEVAGQHLSWPRVKASCEYKTSIRFEDLIDIKLSIERLGEKSVTYDFRFFRGEDLVAFGSLTAVCCVFRHGESLKSCEMPRSFTEAMRRYLVNGEKMA
jgi:acyl-CoA thioester hydrolase